MAKEKREEKGVLFGKMDEMVLFEKIDEIQEIESLKGAFDSERLRWLIGKEVPELMDEEMYDDIVEEVMIQEKVRTVIFNVAKDLGVEINEFVVYNIGDKTIMGVDGKLMDEIKKEMKMKGTAEIGGIELIPGKLWLTL